MAARLGGVRDVAIRPPLPEPAHVPDDQIPIAPESGLVIRKRTPTAGPTERELPLPPDIGVTVRTRPPSVAPPMMASVASALGVALILVSAQQSGMPQADLSRVVQGVFAGIGFIGAAAIIKPRDDDHVRGVTTAASVWATAAIAAAAGLGRVGTAILATGIALVILIVLRRVENKAAADAAQADDPTRISR
jgi:hypothetical protein